MKNKKKKSDKKNSFILKVFWFLNLILIASLILSYFAAYINPEQFWIFAFFGLAYPIIFIVNIGFLAFWLIFKKKYALIVAMILQN